MNENKVYVVNMADPSWNVQPQIYLTLDLEEAVRVAVSYISKLTAPEIGLRIKKCDTKELTWNRIGVDGIPHIFCTIRELELNSQENLNLILSRFSRIVNSLRNREAEYIEDTGKVPYEP